MMGPAWITNQEPTDYERMEHTRAKSQIVGKPGIIHNSQSVGRGFRIYFAFVDPGLQKQW
jgi:hypothetical protein